MSLAWIIYLLELVANVRDTAILMAFLGTVALVLMAAALGVEISNGAARSAEYKSMFRKWGLKRLGSIVLIGWALAIVLPSKTTLAAMIFIPRLAESAVMQKGYEGIELLVDEWVEELRPTTKGGDQ